MHYLPELRLKDELQINSQKRCTGEAKNRPLTISRDGSIKIPLDR